MTRVNKLVRTWTFLDYYVLYSGQHYYYKMSEETVCTADTMFPWFPLYNHGQLIAMGMAVFGHLERVDGERDWFEAPGRRGVEVCTWKFTLAILPIGTVGNSLVVGNTCGI